MLSWIVVLINHFFKKFKMINLPKPIIYILILSTILLSLDYFYEAFQYGIDNRPTAYKHYLIAILNISLPLIFSQSLLYKNKKNELFYKFIIIIILIILIVYALIIFMNLIKFGFIENKGIVYQLFSISFCFILIFLTTRMIMKKSDNSNL